MSEITLKENVLEMFDAVVKKTGTNTYVSIPSRLIGKHVKVLVIQSNEHD